MAVAPSMAPPGVREVCEGPSASMAMRSCGSVMSML